MKKNFFRIALIALAAMLVITGCSGDNSANVSTKTVRVIGTYGKMDAPAARALSRAAETEQMGITSVDKVVVNGKDIKNDLKPVDPNAKPGNNVEFEAQVEVPSKVSFTAEAKPGFVFDEWEVLEDKKASKENPELKKMLKQIDKWLEKNNLEHSETLTDVPAEYIQYLVAEYDNGYYVTLGNKAEAKAAEESVKNDGTNAHPYTVDEFIALGYTEDELTLVISGDNAEEFNKLINHLQTLNKLEELKLKANGATLEKLPALDKLEEIALTGFTFTADIELNNAKNEYKFVDCEFQGKLTITNAKEIEIAGGKATDIVVVAAEEAEFENITLSGSIDLTQMVEGEVEIEGIAKDLVKYNAENKDLEVEFDD